MSTPAKLRFMISNAGTFRRRSLQAARMIAVAVSSDGSPPQRRLSLFPLGESAFLSQKEFESNNRSSRLMPMGQIPSNKDRLTTMHRETLDQKPAIQTIAFGTGSCA